MEPRLKERLVGAAVLLVIAVILIPMILTGVPDQAPITKSNIPASPGDQFQSKIISLDPLTPATGVVDDGPVSQAPAAPAAGAVDPGPVTQDQPQPLPRAVEPKPKPEPEPAPRSQPSAPTVAKPDKDNPRLPDGPHGLYSWGVLAQENAEALSQKLRQADYPAFVEPITRRGETIYRVRVGPELFRADANALLEKLKTNMKLEGIVLHYP